MECRGGSAGGVLTGGPEREVIYDGQTDPSEGKAKEDDA